MSSPRPRPSTPILDRSLTGGRFGRGRARPFAGALAVSLLVAGAAAADPLAASEWTAAAATDALHLPWREAGWTEREAAAHLVDRFTRGPRPGDVDRVVALGLATWLEAQLAAELPEPELERRLAPLDALELSAVEAGRVYAPPAMVLAAARRDGVLDDQGMARLVEDGRTALAADPELRRELVAWAGERGWRPPREIVEELAAGKLLRALHAENQLADLLTDFWFNHFNVSTGDDAARPLVASYERDAVRPHALGRFRDLLGATARHPAMLLYLDNARSAAGEGAPTLLTTDRFARLAGRMAGGGRAGRGMAHRGARSRSAAAGPVAASPPASRRPTGLNENYARELLELHTLGVDGGYAQQDVVEVARAFTGWSVLPPGDLGSRAERRLEVVEQLGATGFVREGRFLFRPDLHDAGAKSVLGRRIAPGGGLEDGEAVLDLVAAHPSTARHLAAKLARRFVSDEPPESLVDRLAGVFRATGGDLAAVVRALAASPEFWAPAARQAKVKTPFELAASALRALDAEVTDPRPVLEVVAALGQPLYACDPPTGYPDRAEAWLGSGALVGRMNFALALAAGELRGVDWSPSRLPVTRGEPFAGAAAAVLAALLPERDPAPVVAALDDLEPPPPAIASGGEQERRRLVALVLGSPAFQRR